MRDQEPSICHAIILSDMVIREEGTGKHSLIGTFMHFNAPRFPFQSNGFYVTVMLMNMAGDVGGFNLAVRIEDPHSGHVLSSASGNIKFKEEKRVQKEDVFEIPIGPIVATFHQAGQYQVTVLVDNEKIGQRPLIVFDRTQSQRADIEGS